jgi:type IV pilus assembly protein PilO
MDLQSFPWYVQFLVFLLIGAVAFGLFYFMMYSGTQDQIKNLDMQIEELDRVIRTAEQKERKLPQLQAEVKRSEELLNKLKEILPESNEIASIIKRVESILYASRLKIQKWASPVERSHDIYIQHQLSIEVDGTYHNLGVFFDQLSKIKKIFNVTMLAIKPGRKKNSDYTINANFQASTYTYHEKKAVPKKGKKRRRG